MNTRLQMLLLSLVLIVALGLMVAAGRFAFETGRVRPTFDKTPFHYAGRTSERFRELISRPGWRAGDPERSDQGLLLAVHERSGLTFALIPEGSFLMGSDDGPLDERPVRRVRLDAFLLSTTECTVGARDLAGKRAGRDADAPMPAQGVSWVAARSWCERAGGGLRLPREAEWEYACRAGTTARWSCGQDPSLLPAHAWYSRNSAEGPRPVGGRRPNAWGLFDMHGNLWEWCEDLWRGDLEGRPVKGEPGPEGPKARVYRGGCWLNIAANCRAANRGRDDPDLSFRYLGFRPAASLP